MRVHESFDASRVTIPSEGAVDLIVGSAKRAYTRVTEAGVRPQRKNNKSVIQFGHIPHSEWPQVDKVTLRFDAETGALAYGLIDSKLYETYPNGYAFTRDYHTTRLQLPKPHDSEETQRAVIDSWVSPVTYLEDRLPIPEGEDPFTNGYQEAYLNILQRRNQHGVPPGAEAVNHLVVGRPGEQLDADSSRKVLYVVNAIGIAAASEVRFQQQLDMAAH